jgi:exoribonuclease-2
MNKHSTAVDLKQLAYAAMTEYGFQAEYPPASRTEISTITAKPSVAPTSGSKDLRGLLWSSIDNIESQDLDQIEYAEQLPNGDIKLLVGIADVDGYVKQKSALDSHAFANAFSIYTGIITFPMLPRELSEGLTSLLQDVDRPAIVTEMVISQIGEIKSSDVYSAIVRNKAKLAYEPVSDWLAGKGDLPLLSTVTGLEEQLRLQDKLSDWLHELHHKHGELTVQTIEPRAVMQNDVLLDLQITEQVRARDIIKNFMISANMALAEFLRQRKSAVIERVVTVPKHWDKIVALASQYNFPLPEEPDVVALNSFVQDRKLKDPEHFPDLSLTVVKLLGPGEYIVQLPGEESVGHFGLAVHEYTHSTAPNRRFPDLVTQRLVKALLSGKPAPYSDDQLSEICDHVVEREDNERKLERYMRKAMAAVLLSDHIGEIYDGIVTGVTNHGSYVRILKPPAEGRVMQHEHGLEVGDHCKVKLVSTNPQQGFIDFVRVSS